MMNLIIPLVSLLIGLMGFFALIVPKYFTTQDEEPVEGFMVFFAWMFVPTQALFSIIRLALPAQRLLARLIGVGLFVAVFFLMKMKSAPQEELNAKYQINPITPYSGTVVTLVQKAEPSWKIKRYVGGDLEIDANAAMPFEFELSDPFYKNVSESAAADQILAQGRQFFAANKKIEYIAPAVQPAPAEPVVAETVTAGDAANDTAPEDMTTAQDTTTQQTETAAEAAPLQNLLYYTTPTPSPAVAAVAGAETDNDTADNTMPAALTERKSRASSGAKSKMGAATGKRPGAGLHKPPQKKRPTPSGSKSKKKGRRK